MKSSHLRHLRLVPDDTSGGLSGRTIGLALLVGVIIIWLFTSVRRLEREVADLKGDITAPPSTRITCVDWQGESFHLELAVDRATADQIIHAIERGISPPYNPTCFVR